jgi:peroxiredoxin
MSLSIGDTAPSHELPDTEGNLHPLHEDGATTVVVFTCNHCPYALAWHERLADVAADYDVRFLAVNPNDAERYPRDSFEAMQQRVAEEGWSFPYLHDEEQVAARDFGALTTPDVFVFDQEGRLRYRGAPDPDHRDPSHQAAWLREALDAVLAGEDVARPQTDPVGCSIKWK